MECHCSWDMKFIIIHILGLLISASCEPEKVPFEAHLPLCNLSNIFHGHWKYPTLEFFNGTRSYIQVDSAFSTCPSTYKHIDQHIFLHDQSIKYACNDYPRAHWHPTNCRILNLEEAILKFNARGRFGGDYVPELTVMGDSLSGQFYVAAKCLSQMKNLTLNVDYILELLYRRDFPCESNCLGDKGREYRYNASKSAFGNSCDGCHDGKLHNLTEIEYNTPWIRMISNRTSVLVLGGGAWFNYYRGFFNSSAVYEETLSFVAPFLHDLIVHRGVDVYWIDLPPCWFEGNLKNERVDYEWDGFSHKNTVARGILEPVGVNYLDSWPALIQRKQHDIGVADAGRLHWW